MFPEETKNLPEFIQVGGEVLGEDQDIIHVDERKLTQDTIHHVLKGVTSFRNLKGILKNLKIPKGVI